MKKKEKSERKEKSFTMINNYWSSSSLKCFKILIKRVWWRLSLCNLHFVWFFNFFFFFNLLLIEECWVDFKKEISLKNLLLFFTRGFDEFNQSVKSREINLIRKTSEVKKEKKKKAKKKIFFMSTIFVLFVFVKDWNVFWSCDFGHLGHFFLIVDFRVF